MNGRPVRDPALARMRDLVLGFQEDNEVNDDVMLDAMIDYVVRGGGQDVTTFLVDRFTVKRCGFCQNRPVAWMTWKTTGHGGSKSAPVCAQCMTAHDKPDNFGDRPSFRSIVPVVA